MTTEVEQLKQIATEESLSLTDLLTELVVKRYVIQAKFDKQIIFFSLDDFNNLRLVLNANFCNSVDNNTIARSLCADSLINCLC